ncbi:MAG: 3-dehydroquinate synthase [Pseudomonadota bacterium]
MTKINITLDTRAYDILIEAGLLARAGEWLASYAREGRLVVVTDANVANHVLPRLASSCETAGINIDSIVLPAGEATKSWPVLAELCDALLQRGVERSDTIIALGGGVIGDLVGFAASILKRGCQFVQIPTTLLAQVDSSVGGKTAINVAAGKNLVGTFHQPALVLIDPEVLDTLPPREMRSGYAEVLKYGLIDDFAFFEWCEGNAAALLAGGRTAQVHAIAASVSAKARIVAADERETHDIRALLNLGHTFGHALEAEAGFSDRLLHGEAVAAGMAMAFRYSARLGLCTKQEAERITAHIAACGLPTTLAEAGINAGGEALVDHMRHDKKMSGGTLPFILARGIGQSFVAKDVALADVGAFLDEEAS